MKENKDRNIQNEFLAMLQNCIQTFDEAENMLNDIHTYICDELPKEQSRIDLLRSDYLHILENCELGDAAKIAIATKLEENATDRRNMHNIATVAREWMTHEKKIYNSASRCFLKDIISKKVNELDQPYKYRVLEEQEINDIINTRIPCNNKQTDRNKRKKRQHFTEDDIKNIFDMLDSGNKVKEIAEKMNANLSSIYAVIKRYDYVQRNKN